MGMKSLLSPCSHDVMVLIISDAIPQKSKQSLDNFVTCGGCIQSSRTIYSETCYLEYFISPRYLFIIGGVEVLSSNKEQEN